MFEKKWSTGQMSDQSNKTAIVTGANVGLGFKSALELSRKGAHVIIGCRSIAKGETAISRIKLEVPKAKLELIPLDLADNNSIRSFSDSFYKNHNTLDLLLNNAGVVNLESLQRTSDGHEMHMATNHLGHFALTGLLAKALFNSKSSRVVTLTSAGYKVGEIDFEDFKREKRSYSRVKAYADSKLANVLFSYQLQKYFDNKGASCISVSAHPGLTGTERQQSIGVGGTVSSLLASTVENGCRPQLMAATAPFIKGGECYGPRFGLWGAPVLHKIKKSVLSDETAQKLWVYSEAQTGVKFP